FLPNLPTYPNPLQSSPAYAIVKQHFVDPEDVVFQKIVTQKNSARGVQFRCAGPQEKVYFKSDDVRACIVTCGGLCPGINIVIREIVCRLNYMYGVDDVLVIEGGYRGFYSRNTITLAPKSVNDIHKRGELLTRMCDDIRKKGNLTRIASSNLIDREDEIFTEEECQTIYKVVMIVSLLSDIDDFIEFYSRKLARRLLEKTNGDPREIYVLEMITEQYGAQATHKMRPMYDE
ncbi:hypothetical protein GIB67_011694, partial [Kingdonia uniflora]